jgi:2-methylcitrate dehydratase PrpD
MLAASQSLTADLAERSSSISFESLPGDVVEIARQGLLDWFAVTLGGCREDAPQLLDRLLPSAAGEADLMATVVGRRALAHPLTAALINGTASHRLDFDDVNVALVGHASVAVTAAVLALAEQLDVSGEQLAVGYVAGYETTCRLAASLGPEPYLRGLHTTGAFGCFGAAAGCSRLLELNAAETATALGIAASLACGVKANIGTMTKSLHAGRSCEGGLLAATLAAEGFTANPAAIEAPQGFADVIASQVDSAPPIDPADGWFLRSNVFKYHAACFMTHSTIDGVRHLRETSDLEVEDVLAIRLHVSDLELGACAIEQPTTALEVKFSIAHLAAMALLGRSTSRITDADACDPAIARVRSRVTLVPDAAPGPATLVEIALTNGESLDTAIDVSAPATDLSVQHDRLIEKFYELAVPVLGRTRAVQLSRAVAGTDEKMPIRELMALARPE